MWDIDRDDKDTDVAAKCPQCSDLMADMGLDFASPKMTELKKWEHLKSLYAVGITFHSCGCSGPGYIPNSKEGLMVYFDKLLENYTKNLSFWRERKEPQNDREINREMSKNWSFIGQVPNELRPKKGAISNEDAKIYWIGRIKEVNGKLAVLKGGGN